MEGRKGGRWGGGDLAGPRGGVSVSTSPFGVGRIPTTWRTLASQLASDGTEDP